MASALGSTNGRVDRGSRVADIRDFGAKPGGDVAFASANRIAIQAAHDWLAATAVDTNQGGDVYIPSGEWYIDRPVHFDGRKIGVRGEGMSRTRIRGGGTSHDLFVFGILRKPVGVSLTSDHFVDLFNGGAGGARILDASAVTGPNQKWGLRTNGDAHLAQQGGNFDAGFGDHYKGWRQLTVDACIDFTNAPGTGVVSGSAGWPTSGSLFGMTDTGKAFPFNVDISNNKVRVQFRTVDPAGGVDAGINRVFFFYPLPVAPGVVRLTFQIDLVAATVATWVDGVQTTPQLATKLQPSDGFTPEANLQFVANQHAPFGLGSNASFANRVFDFWGGPIDITFCGLKISKVPIYQNLGTGIAQARLDAVAINDQNRYFTRVPSTTTALLPLTDTPATVIADRVVTSNGIHSSTFYFLDNYGHGATVSFDNCGECKGLSLTCASTKVGSAIRVGYALDLKVTDCELNGGAYGFSCLNFGSNYPLDIRDCEIGGNDSCINLFFSSSVRIQNVFLDREYRVGIRLSEGVEAAIYGVFTPAYGIPEYIIKATRSYFTLANVVIDNEDTNNGGPLIAYFYASPNDFLPISAYIKIENIFGACSQANAAFLILDDGPAEDGVGYRHALVDVNTVALSEQQRGPFVRINGPRWNGVVRADDDIPRVPWIENTSGNPGGVVSQHNYFNGPPRDAAWTKNSHILTIRNPTVGQFAEFRCLTSGAYGTAAPPTWYGLNPIDDGLSLAAYISDNPYWSAAGSPAGSQGMWKNGAAAATINAIFGGTMPAKPTQLYASVLFRWAHRARFTIEQPSQFGYARVAVPPSAWATSVNGVITNSDAITFGTATGGSWDYYGLKLPFAVLGLHTAQTGGNIIGSVDLPPVLITSDSTPVIGPGAISIQPAAPSPQGSFSPGIHDLQNNFWLKSQAFTPPTIFLALSLSPADVALPPVEPSGGSYARVATSSPGSWSLSPNATLNSNGATGTTALVRNASTLTFPAPTGDWGTVRSVYLMDAASGGNILAAANLTIPRGISSGSPARSFAPGALWITK